MHNLRIFAFGAAMALCSAAALCAEDLSVGTTRHDFAARISKLREGDSKDRARELLGPPDDVRTHRDRDMHYTVDRGVEVWCYGTNGHLTLPTLGMVLVDDDGKVVYIVGNGGKPPDPEFFEEDQLRTLLRQVDRLQSDSWFYNPARTIEVVNALQPLGKEKALAAVDEYLRVCSAWNDDAVDGIFLMLRVLFDPPDDPGYWPMNDREFITAFVEPKNPKLVPRFPIVLEDDIPLLVFCDAPPELFLTSGPRTPLEHRMACFRRGGRMRQRPLMPSNHPAAAIEALIKSPPRLTRELKQEAVEYSRNFAVNQLLWLVESVYRQERFAKNDVKLFAGDDADLRQKLVAEVAKLDIRWDAAKNRYTFKDGTSLTDAD